MSDLRAILRYGPSVASNVTGVPRVTLRSWRKRYGFPRNAAAPGNSRSQPLTLDGLASLKLFALLMEKAVPGDLAAQVATEVRTRISDAINGGKPMPEWLILAYEQTDKGPKDAVIRIVKLGEMRTALVDAAEKHLFAMVFDLQQVVASVERGFSTWRLLDAKPRRRKPAEAASDATAPKEWTHLKLVASNDASGKNKGKGASRNAGKDSAKDTRKSKAIGKSGD